LAAVFYYLKYCIADIDDFCVAVCKKGNIYNQLGLLDWAFDGFLKLYIYKYYCLCCVENTGFIYLIKNRNGELPDEIRQKYKTKVTHHMAANKPYLNPNLSLNSFADEISISPKHLSQIINSSFHQNFYHYINSYRIEECIKKLRDKTQSNDNILDIAFESGFNSKNTFNSAFKKCTGMTPTEFKKNQIGKN
jgi:AraC-like DNA-binding protein